MILKGVDLLFWVEFHLSLNLSFSCHLFTFQPVNQTEGNWGYAELLLPC